MSGFETREKYIEIACLVVLMSVSVIGCTFADDKINVMATTVPLGYFVEMVGDDKVNVDVLVPPGANPHTFEPRPSQIATIEDVDIYIKNGAGLENWMGDIIDINSEMLVVDSSVDVELIESANSEEVHENILTTNPHIWLSLRNAAIMVDNICDGLIEVDPKNKAHYLQNKDEFIAELEYLDSKLEKTFDDVDRKEFVVLHPAWSYLARDYGLIEIPILLTEKEPGPRYLATIVDTARDKDIITIFVDPNFNPKSAEIIANEIDGQVVALNPLAENYLDNFNQVANEIAISLES